MKKIVLLTLALMLVVAMTACGVIDKTHYCESKCPVCGGCQDEGCVVSVCSNKCQGNHDEHQHTLTKVDGKSATCVESGFEAYFTCECGKMFADEAGEVEIESPVVIEATGHTEVAVEAKASTCTEAGLSEGKACSVCGEIFVAQEEIPALGHSIVIDAAIDATCTESGLSAGEHCEVCDYKVAQEEIPALGHSIVIDAAVDATCTESGLTAGEHCEVCDYKVAQEVVDALGHSEQIVAGQAATCTVTGLTDGKLCSVCGEVLVAQEVIPATGHAYDNDRDESCNNCGYIRDVECLHENKVAIGEAQNATCTSGGITAGQKCADCDEIFVAQEVVPALGHTNSDVVVENKVNPDCINAGSYDNVIYCSVCNAEISRETVAVNALGHSEEIVAGKNASCTEAGITDGKKCSVCGETLVEQEEIPAFGHNLVNHECSACGYYDLGENVTIYFENNWLWTNVSLYYWYGSKDTNNAGWPGEALTKVGKSTGGNDIYEVVIPSNIKGFIISGIKNDGSGNRDQTPDIKSGWSNCLCYYMSWNNGNTTGTYEYHNNEVVKVDPDCINTGSEDTTCKVCGKSDSKEIPAKGHTEEIVAGKAATCTESGLTNGKKCSVCNEVLLAQEEIFALGHTNSDVVVENNVSPACGVAGSYDNVVYCATCNAELSRDSVSVDALEHTEVVVSGYAATCTTKGLTDGTKCSACGIAIVEQTEIETRPHAWNNPVITVEGKVGTVTYTCKDCNTVDQYTGPVNNDEKHVCDHLVNGIETEYGQWTACSVCGAKSYAQTALSAYKGSGATHASVDAYVLKDGATDATNANNMVKTGIKVSDVAVSYNLNNADKSKGYIDFTYTITVTEATTVNVYFNGRSTNTYSDNINYAAQINKFMKLYQGNTEISIPDSAALPKYKEGSPYWTEQQVATVELSVGENTFTFRFTQDGGIYNKGSKYYGAYVSYFRFAENSKIKETCDNNYHDLELVYGSPVSCTQDGVQMHYACKNCGKLFDYYTKVEVKYENLIIPAYDEHIYDSIPHPRTDAEGNDYFAYFCVRGCGAEKIHTCTNDGNHLIIAREPNQVWYEDGDTFNPDRMEVYLSGCAEGCGDNALVAGHLVGYDALSYTYQNGDSFKAGDEYITISYTLDGVTYSAKLPVTVTAVGKTITVDNGSAGFGFTNVPGVAGDDHSNAPGVRVNDQGKVGQSAYGGSYTNNFTDGDIAKFTFTLDEAGEANIVLRAATDRITGNIKYAYETIASEMMVIYIDGQVVNLDDSVVFNGSVANLDPNSNRWTWTVWSNLDLGTYNLSAGEHTVEIVYNNISNYKSAEGYSAHVQLDCLNIFLAD